MDEEILELLQEVVSKMTRNREALEELPHSSREVAEWLRQSYRREHANRVESQGVILLKVDEQGVVRYKPALEQTWRKLFPEDGLA